MITGIHLDYQELRAISPKAARQALLQILRASNGNVAKTAKLLKVTRATVYKAIKKKKIGNLDDNPRVAKYVHNKTPISIESKVVEIKKKTKYGPIRLSEELFECFKIKLSFHTIRNILRRNKLKTKGRKHKPHKKGVLIIVLNCAW